MTLMKAASANVVVVQLVLDDFRGKYARAQNLRHTLKKDLPPRVRNQHYVY